MKGHKITWIVGIIAFLIVFILIAYAALSIDSEEEPNQNSQAEVEDSATRGDAGLLAGLDGITKKN